MNKFKGILFCTDLDGTLFRDDKTVSKENLDAIEYFKSEGGLFTFITGRIPQTSAQICATVKPNAPYGCLNGAGIYDHESKQYIWRLPLADGVLELVREVDRRLPDLGIQFNTDKNILFCKDNDALVYFRAMTGAPYIAADYESIDDTVLKIIFAHNDEDRIAAVARLLSEHPLSDRFDFIRSEHRLYEILPKGASKGRALCKMAELFGIDQSKTIAIGDYDNDVSMIKAARLGVAVSNAAVEAKAVADYVGVSNNESAIADVVDKLDSGEIAL